MWVLGEEKEGSWCAGGLCVLIKVASKQDLKIKETVSPGGLGYLDQETRPLLLPEGEAPSAGRGQCSFPLPRLTLMIPKEHLICKGQGQVILKPQTARPGAATRFLPAVQNSPDLLLAAFSLLTLCSLGACHPALK